MRGIDEQKQDFENHDVPRVTTQSENHVSPRGEGFEAPRLPVDDAVSLRQLKAQDVGLKYFSNSVVLKKAVMDIEKCVRDNEGLKGIFDPEEYIRSVKSALRDPFGIQQGYTKYCGTVTLLQVLSDLYPKTLESMACSAWKKTLARSWRMGAIPEFEGFVTHVPNWHELMVTDKGSLVALVISGYMVEYMGMSSFDPMGEIFSTVYALRRMAARLFQPFANRIAVQMGTYYGGEGLGSPFKGKWDAISLKQIEMFAGMTRDLSERRAVVLFMMNSFVDGQWAKYRQEDHWVRLIALRMEGSSIVMTFYDPGVERFEGYTALQDSSFSSVRNFQLALNGWLMLKNLPVSESGSIFGTSLN